MVVTEFLRDVHEGIYKDGGYGHALPEILFECGGEALYHFGGILIECAGEGRDLGGMVNDSIARLGYRLSRFRTVVDKWKMEKDWDEEDRLADVQAENQKIPPLGRSTSQT
jgi:hypothetical protein